MNAAKQADFDISAEMAASNIVPLKQLSHEERLERLADVHREKEHSARQYATDIRKRMKIEAAGFKADDKAEDARHAEAKALIAEQAAASKERNEALIAGAKKMEAYNRVSSRAALDALVE